MLWKSKKIKITSNIYNIKLSENFKLYEFIWSDSCQKFIIPTYYQLDKLKYLAQNILQPIRNKFGSLKVTSGLRDLEVYRELKRKGLPASKTSDHFMIPYYIKRGSKYYVPDNSPNPRGKGAADFIPLKSNIWDVYYWIIANFKPIYDFNQVIIYDPKYSNINTAFIHIANPAHIHPPKNILPSKRPVLVYVGGNEKFTNHYVPFQTFIKYEKGFKI